MDRVLEEFILALRRWGVRVSPAESMDAARVVELVGYSDREVLKGSLSAALAKSKTEKDLFDRCFERFFTLNLPVLSGTLPDDESGEGDQAEQSPLTRMLLSGDRAGLSVAMQMAAGAVDVSALRFFTQKGQVTQKIFREMQLDEFSVDMERFRRIGSAGAGALQRSEQELFEAVREQIERQFALFVPSAADTLPEEHFMTARLSSIDRRDYERVQKIARRMARHLNALYSRRRKAARVGWLDFKKTFRDNIANQAVLFQTRWKKKRPDRPEVIAICDISRSVSHISRFFLLFLYSLNEIVTRIRTFLFCSNLVEASHVFESYALEEAIGRIEVGQGLQIAMGLTDYGRALLDFKENHLQKVSRRTTVFIIGDARNNYDDPRADILRLIRQKCRRIIWLNPENPVLWGTGDSVMKSYLPCCDVARECNTLNHFIKVAAILGRTKQ